MNIMSGTYDDQVNVYSIVCFVQGSYLGLHVARYHAVTDRVSVYNYTKIYSKYRYEAHPLLVSS